MKIAQGNSVLVTYALGSCIGLCFHDPRLKLGALLHIMLPINMETGRTHPMKYADTGIRETLKQMEARGSSRSRITVKIAGGAKMFEIAGGSGLGNILKRENIRLLAQEVGGKVARTLFFDVNTGQGCVRSYGQKDIFF